MWHFYYFKSNRLRIYYVPRTVLSFPLSKSFNTATDDVRRAVITCIFTGVNGGVESMGRIQQAGPAGDRARSGAGRPAARACSYPAASAASGDASRAGEITHRSRITINVLIVLVVQTRSEVHARALLCSS